MPCLPTSVKTQLRRARHARPLHPQMNEASHLCSLRHEVDEDEGNKLPQIGAKLKVRRERGSSINEEPPLSYRTGELLRFLSKNYSLEVQQRRSG